MSDDLYDEIIDGLFIGNSRAARDFASKFDYRISVARGLEFKTTSYSFDLDVDNTNQIPEFAGAVSAVQKCLGDGKTLVHCHEGRERAPTVVAAVLSLLCDCGFDGALQYISGRRPIVDPTPELRSMAKEFLEETSSPND